MTLFRQSKHGKKVCVILTEHHIDSNQNKIHDVLRQSVPLPEAGGQTNQAASNSSVSVKINSLIRVSSRSVMTQNTGK